MADYHQIVDQIRGFVQSSDQTRNERLEGLASVYAEACVEVNQRLGRCQWLLQQGLRSEAIQLAESEPKLLGAIATLDFHERADWDELVGIYALAAAPTLLVEAASFLNEAYAQEEPLQDLLRTHRRQAMQRAPLRLRIGTMRKLAAQDPNNLVWADDRRAFEKARFRQIQVEAAEAVRLQDSGQITRLLAEVQDQTWAQPPPKALVEGLTKADAQLRGQQTRAALADLEARLTDAFAARDPIRGRIARQEWIARTASGPLEPGDPIWDRVGSALRWLDDEDRRTAADHAQEAALAALVQALDEPGFIAPAQLERLGQEVLSHGRGMPEGLQLRYVSRLQAAETAHARRFHIIAAGSAAGVLLAGSLIFYLVRSHVRTGDATQAAVALTDMLELGELEQAGEFVAKLEKADPGLFSYPSLIAARQHYQAARSKEADRALAFDKRMREAEQAPLAQAEPKSLQTVRSMARSDTEKAAIAQLVQRRQAALQAERAKHETTLRPRLDEISREIYQIGQWLDGAKVESSQIFEAIAHSQRALTDLAPEVALAGDEVQGLARALDQKIQAARDRLAQLERQARLQAQITQAVAYSAAGQADNLGQLADRLQAYLAAYPNETRSREFKQTLNEQPLWNAVEAWNRLVSGWQVNPDGLPAQEAQLRAALCGRFLTQHPAFPGTAEVALYQKYLEAIARRSAGADGPVSRLQRLFSDILVDNVWMVTIKDSDANGRSIVERYYTLKQPTRHGEFVQFTSIISFTGKEVSHTIVKDRIASIGLSPQSLIATRFKPILADESKRKAWGKVMLDLVDAILREPEIEPILQVVLLRKVVGAAGEGSEPLRKELEATKNQLDQSAVDVNVPWMNPDTLRLERTQAVAAQLVQSLRPAVPAAKQVLQLRDQIERSVARTYRTVGWLARDREGWRIRTGVAIPNQRDLWIIAPLENQHGEWRKVGTITGGKPAIDTRDSSSLAEGRPVFVIVRSL